MRHSWGCGYPEDPCECGKADRDWVYATARNDANKVIRLVEEIKQLKEENEELKKKNELE